jgi:23S rRNA U2552 (ribose-2'-O)-methylase RlmE/FtsJ
MSHQSQPRRFCSNTALTNDQKTAKFSTAPRGSASMSKTCTRFGDPFELFQLKTAIDTIDTFRWKNARLFVNNYEFNTKGIVNRAVYKCIELYSVFGIADDLDCDSYIFHCAEAPGGFIQATNGVIESSQVCTVSGTPANTPEGKGEWTLVHRHNHSSRPRVYTMSLRNTGDARVPMYTKNPNVIIPGRVRIDYGIDGTGDITNWKNIDHIGTLAGTRFNMVTADGGFDEGIHFNNKEQLHYSLVFSEVYSAVRLLARGGNFIVKVFDLFTETSAHIVYLLTLLFDDVFMYKPKTSRPTNSEKYIVCKYLNCDNEFRSFVLQKLQKSMVRKTFALFDSLDSQFVSELKSANEQFLVSQCKYLQVAVNLCSSRCFIENVRYFIDRSSAKKQETFELWVGGIRLADTASFMSRLKEGVLELCSGKRGTVSFS